MPRAAVCAGNQHGKGEKLQCGFSHCRAIGLHVEIVTPASNGLRHDHAGSDGVQYAQQRNFLAPAVPHRAKYAADYAAVDRQASLPDVQRGDGVSGKGIPGKNNVIQPCADDAQRNDAQCKIDHCIFRQGKPLFFAAGPPQGEDDTGCNQRAVPWERSEYIPSGRHCRHRKSSFCWHHYRLFPIGCQACAHRRAACKRINAALLHRHDCCGIIDGSKNTITFDTRRRILHEQGSRF